jgi:hypothetical protein
MAVMDSNVVDAISLNDKDVAVLSIIDELPWEGDHLLFLQEKLNTYISFIESGEIYSSYPQAKNKDLAIKIISRYEIDKEGKCFLDQVKPILSKMGVSLNYTKFEESESKGAGS